MKIIETPDTLVSTAVVGAALLVYGTGYLSGRQDASGLPTNEWAAQIASNGPLWPTAFVLAGFGLLGATTALMLVRVYTGER